MRSGSGELFLDADGRPVRAHEGTVSYSGMYREYHEVTAEEIGILEELAETARIVSTSDEQISRIIREETESFFQAQISVEKAAAAIQNRVRVYPDESR